MREEGGDVDEAVCQTTGIGLSHVEQDRIVVFVVVVASAARAEQGHSTKRDEEIVVGIRRALIGLATRVVRYEDAILDSKTRFIQEFLNLGVIVVVFAHRGRDSSCSFVRDGRARGRSRLDEQGEITQRVEREIRHRNDDATPHMQLTDAADGGQTRWWRLGGRGHV